MFVLIARNLQQRSRFSITRQGHTGPSRLRLKRKDKRKEDNPKSQHDPFIFHPRVRTIEPVRQALRNTKTLIYNGLPSGVLSGMNSLPFENLLPQINHNSVVGVNDRNVKHIRHSKGIIMNVVKAAWSCADRYPGLLRQTVSYRPDLKISWKRYGYNFQVSGRTGLLFSSELALPNFASNMEVKNTIEMPVDVKDELISPVFELSQNLSRKDIDSGFYYDVFPFPQTLVITEQNWKLPHLIAQGLSDKPPLVSTTEYVCINDGFSTMKAYGIMFSFGRLVERAVSKDRTSIGGTLQNPMSIRSIVYNDKKLILLCYQLNTLDFDNDKGVKNQLWLSPECPISFHNRDLDQHVDRLEIPEKDLKELVAFLLYGQDKDTTPQSSVI